MGYRKNTQCGGTNLVYSTTNDANVGCSRGVCIYSGFTPQKRATPTVALAKLRSKCKAYLSGDDSGVLLYGRVEVLTDDYISLLLPFVDVLVEALKAEEKGAE